MRIDLDQIDVEQLVAYEGYEYHRSNGNRGPQLNVRTCPFCHSDAFKVYMNADTGLGNCFRCDATFNKLKFICAARGFDITSSRGKALGFQYLQNIYSNVSYKQKVKQYIDVKLNKDWKYPLNKRIELDADVPQYLLDRGVDAKIAKRFDLRFCDAGFYKYEDYSTKAKFVDFSNRIIIPIRDVAGNPVTFQGRDVTGKSEKKYLFPNMLPGTARYIYNADYIIKNGIKKVVLNEGVFDVFATTRALESEVSYMQWGACGTFGKHFSIQTNTREAEDQLADLAVLKSQGVDEFVIMWDGEPKARVAAIEAGLKLRAYGFPVKVALGLPDGCDPAECSSRDVLNALDNRAIPTELMLVRHRMQSETSLP